MKIEQIEAVIADRLALLRLGFAADGHALGPDTSATIVKSLATAVYIAALEAQVDEMQAERKAART